MALDVLVFGSAIMDFICYTPRLPKAGETVHGHKFETGFGGKGANQCVAAARLGASTVMVAKLGDDKFGNDYLKHLQNEGVNVEYVQLLTDRSTGIAQIAVSDDGENNIIIAVGANNFLAEGDVVKAHTLFTTAKVLLCQLETPINGTIAALRNFKGISILNASPALANTPKELLQLASILCVNEIEAALMIATPTISNLEDAKSVTKILIEMGANTVIVTLGALGAVYARKEEPGVTIHVPSHAAAKVVDTTGAGDAFLGALAFYIAQYPQLAMHQQIGGACRIASHSVQYLGTQTSFPHAKDINVDLEAQSFEWKEI